MNSSRWKQLLRDRAGESVDARADVLGDALLAESSPADEIAGVAELAGDHSVTVDDRLAALLAVSLASTRRDLLLPEAAFDALEDTALVETAIRGGHGHVLTAILYRAPDQPGYRALRRMVGRRLLAAGERGPNVTAILVASGDHDAAVRAAADDFEARLLPAAGRTSALAQAWARTALDWFSEHGENMFGPLARELGRRDAAAPRMLAELLEDVPGADPTLVEAARRALLGGERN